MLNASIPFVPAAKFPTTIAPLQPLLTLADSAKLLGCSRRTVERLIADGTLPTIKLGSLRRIDPGDLRAMLDTLKDGPRATGG